jgi:hypothetical protein
LATQETARLLLVPAGRAGPVLSAADFEADADATPTRADGRNCRRSCVQQYGVGRAKEQRAERWRRTLEKTAKGLTSRTSCGIR